MRPLQEKIEFGGANHRVQMQQKFQAPADKLDDDGAIYLGVIVEYFGVIPHAWLVKEEKVIERTPHHEGKQLYFGMEVDRKEYMQKQKNNTRRHDMFDLYVFDGMGI